MREWDSTQKRAQALLEKMTLNEKVGQLCQRLYGFQCYEVVNGQISLGKKFKKEVEKYSGIGCLYGLYRADPWSQRNFENGLTGELALKAYNMAQEYCITHSRLGIPMLMSSESPHGHQALDGYLLPVNLAVGATFHPELFCKAGQVCGEQLARMGVNLALVSCLDILRDPRWGRSEECFSEDPYLASCFAKAIVKGIQSSNVGVVAKHFCAQGETTGGINGTAARIGNRELHEIHLPAVKACVDAGVTGVMAAYNEIDGVFCHANHVLLKDILRNELGFSGIVMSDGEAIDRLDMLTGDNTSSAALALNAGVTIGLWDTAFSRLEEACQRGLVEEKKVDQAVLQVLQMKLQMGLFEKPYLDQYGNRAKQPWEKKFYVSTYEDNRESEQLAKESIILLKNMGILPLNSGLKKQQIAVIGPNADEIYCQIGDYSPPLRKGKYYTVLDGLRTAFSDCEFLYCNGEDQQEAVTIAREAKAVIMVLGGSSSRFGKVSFEANGEASYSTEVLMDCGEGVDSSSLHIPNRQEELLKSVSEVNSAIITVVIAGRPYILTQVEEYSKALLLAFYPGPMGGKAIAEIIRGSITPSGRLPVSLPRSTGQLPVYYNQKISRRVMKYCDEIQGSHHRFGEGFGYGKIIYSNFRMEKRLDGTIIICFQAENKGNYEDYAVMQSYRVLVNPGFSPRTEELVGFTKIKIEPGQTTTGWINLEKRLDYYYSIRNKYEHVPGDYIIRLEDNGVTYWETHIKTDEYK